MSATSFALIATSVGLSIAALIFAALTAARVRACERQLRSSSGSRVESLARSVADMSSTLEELANRVKMQRVRAATNHVKDAPAAPTGEPDPYKDPDGWRKMINSRIATAKIGGTR